jgi:hypothetical protein
VDNSDWTSSSSQSLYVLGLTEIESCLLIRIASPSNTHVVEDYTYLLEIKDSSYQNHLSYPLSTEGFFITLFKWRLIEALQNLIGYVISSLSSITSSFTFILKLSLNILEACFGMLGWGRLFAGRVGNYLRPNIFFFEPNTCIRLTIKFMAKYEKEDAMIDAIVAACTAG